MEFYRIARRWIVRAFIESPNYYSIAQSAGYSIAHCDTEQNI